MSRKPVINGLYAITPDGLFTDELVRRVLLVLRGGARVLQYRNKSADRELCLEQAQALRAVTQIFSVPLIINDNVELALQVNADGVHLGAEDGSVSEARARLGVDKWIGVSCYNDASLAREAVQHGADYVAFGAFFPSSVKPGAVKAEKSLLQAARRELNVPIVAIGGITVQNGASLLVAGADALAVISAVFEAEDIQSSAQEFSTLISKVQHDISQSRTV